MADDPAIIKGKRVLVVEDAPLVIDLFLTFGAGTLAARQYGAAEIVDPRPYVVGSIAETFRKYPAIGILLPAMGYGPEQIHDLEATINNVPCDAVIIGTPIDLRRILHINKPSTRVQYSLQERTHPDLKEILDAFVRKRNLRPKR